MTKRFTPAFFIALLNVIVFAVMNGFQLATQIPIHYVNKWIMLGVDYHDFYEASVHVLSGQSPYQVDRYVTPPLFAFANIPLAIFGFGTARVLFMSLIPFAVLLSFLGVHRALRDSDTQDDDWLLLSGILVILFSYPFYFLFERGNIDGVVLLCMCLSLVLIPKQSWLGGLLMALAIQFKLYPILLFIPLFLSRRWKPFLWTCGWTLIFTFLLIPYWGDYFILLSRRSNSFQLFENGSLVNTLLFVGKLISGAVGKSEVTWRYAPAYAAIIYGILVSILVLADYKFFRIGKVNQNMVNALLYFPFMVALPKSVYHYEFVILLPLLPVVDYLWKDAPTSLQHFALGMTALGIALTQWQAVVLYTLTDNIGAYYIPGFGLLLAMTGISIYKLLQLREAPQQDQSAPLSTKEEHNKADALNA